MDKYREMEAEEKERRKAEKKATEKEENYQARLMAWERRESKKAHDYGKDKKKEKQKADDTEKEAKKLKGLNRVKKGRVKDGESTVADLVGSPTLSEHYRRRRVSPGPGQGHHQALP